MCSYFSGCRCENCKAKHRERMRVYAANRRKREPGWYAGRQRSATVKRLCTACNEPLLRGGARAANVAMHKECRLRTQRWARRRRAALDRIRVAAEGTSGSLLWTQGCCTRCGAEFCTRGAEPAAYCSRRCKIRAANSRRKMRVRDAYISDVSPAKVFLADGYRCHICHRKTDPTKVVPHPKAPTIDHVIPLANGGKHEPANCRTACFRCNYLKNAGGGGEQLLLFA